MIPGAQLAATSKALAKMNWNTYMSGTNERGSQRQTYRSHRGRRRNSLNENENRTSDTVSNHDATFIRGPSPRCCFWHWAKVFLLSAVLYLALSLLCERSSVQMKGSIFRKVTGRNPFGLFGHFGWTVLILYLIFSTQLKAFYNYHSLGLCFT